jgi:hypothetical protein
MNVCKFSILACIVLAMSSVYKILVGSSIKVRALGAAGQNNTMVGRQKLRLLYRVFLEFF